MEGTTNSSVAWKWPWQVPDRSWNGAEREFIVIIKVGDHSFPACHAKIFFGGGCGRCGKDCVITAMLLLEELLPVGVLLLEVLKLTVFIR